MAPVQSQGGRPEIPNAFNATSRTILEVSMRRRALGGRQVRAALDQLGVRLLDESEYAEVALRLSIILESLEPLMAAWPPADEFQLPADLPRPRSRRG
jgi:hypothetical protein